MSTIGAIIGFAIGIGIAEYYTRRIQRILQERIDELAGRPPRKIVAKKKPHTARIFVTEEEMDQMRAGQPIRKKFKGEIQ